MSMETLNRNEPPLASIILFFVFQALFPSLVHAANTEWTLEQFSLKWGSVIAEDNKQALESNEDGKLFFALPVQGQQLDDQHLLKIRFDSPGPLKFFVLWQTNIGDAKLFQTEINPPVAGENSYDLSALPDWTGTLKTLGLGFSLPPHQRITVESVSLDSPTLIDSLMVHWQNWSEHRSWQAADINHIPGTRVQAQGVYPVPFFAGLTALALTLLLLIHLLHRKGHPFNWRIAGGVILCIWILSDTFWHARLWHQAALTWETFGGKSTQDKLLASEESQLITFTQEAKSHIHSNTARVFIASASDYAGMNTAYFMSPLNAYWNRGGEELPSGKDLRSGDYILIVPPSRVAYEGESSAIHFTGEPSIKVTREYSSTFGMLLKVI